MQHGVGHLSLKLHGLEKNARLLAAAAAVPIFGRHEPISGDFTVQVSLSSVHGRSKVVNIPGYSPNSEI